MTLTELLPAIQQLSAQEKLKLIRILAEELDTQDNISPLEPYKTYYLPTPYDNFGVAEVLMATMPQVEQAN
ncbi:hypothetical protein H6G33_08300 [Calothrix sp. FACHB-1219]|uniref:hypothetical protein n=1 Tax=unclassified Calothrix TaxID=2619626 RepID=UPI001684093F|nr:MULTISPECIES: hypothetical protein [unclassified Calothrix]MBD2201994.1 hypothetical protein [Calothrix sp. FACHB-168]MBD2217030.1 hypothetical protein [Calothrix sp. FACHB-1219]